VANGKSNEKAAMKEEAMAVAVTKLPEGFEPEARADDAACFLGAEDFAAGLVWQFRLVDARLIADEEGGYRVTYAGQLTDDPPPSRASVERKVKGKLILIELRKGDTVLIGEKARINFRDRRIGDEVWLKSLGKVPLKGGRTMLDMKLATRTSKTPGAKIDEHLRAAFSRTGATLDPWDAEAIAKADGKEGTDAIPF
jgi:hypothetical protein